jgi:dipeptidase D
MNEIRNLKSERIWKYFYDLTQIPRPTGHCTAVADYVEGVGQSLGLATSRDKAGNVIIRKPATQGRENSPVVVLQSHLDMVPQANDTRFDFTRRPIEARVDDGWVRASGTTLGADNGIGVAAALDILSDNSLQHGPVEALFTVDEEVGMVGANEITADFVKGKILLNLDSELDGDLYIGCAGGEDVSATMRYDAVAVEPSDDTEVITLTLSGLHGGHSGVDIHLGRANANKQLFRFLRESAKKCAFDLVSAAGGSARNAIPREATAGLLVKGEDNIRILLRLAEEFEKLIKEEFDGIEDVDMVKFTVERRRADKIVKIVPESDKVRFVNAVNGCPNGVENMFARIPDTVETSSNLAIVNAGNGSMEVKFLVRSSSDSKKEALCGSIVSVFENAGFEVKCDNSYPGWDPNYASPTLDVMKRVFLRLRDCEPKVKVMHAGLECGIILANIPDLDAVSFGPTIKYPHSPDEKVEIESVARFREFLAGVLEDIK